jgi:hypothetical protein
MPSNLRVCLVLAHDKKKLVELLVSPELASIGKKIELDWPKRHWHAKYLATQTKTEVSA